MTPTNHEPTPGAPAGRRAGRGPTPPGAPHPPARAPHPPADEAAGPAEPDATPELPEDPFPPAAEVLLPDVAAVAAERDEYLGALQRLQADFENYRKRVARQQEEQSARAAKDLVGKLLPVLDTLDLAETHLGSAADSSDEAKALVAARAQLLDALAREGLERVDAAEVVFDPESHDAVAWSAAGEDAGAPVEAAGEGSGGEGAAAPEGADGGAGAPGLPMVEEVLRSGYRWRGSTLRPAMVRVRG